MSIYQEVRGLSDQELDRQLSELIPNGRYAPAAYSTDYNAIRAAEILFLEEHVIPHMYHLHHILGYDNGDYRMVKEFLEGRLTHNPGDIDYYHGMHTVLSASPRQRAEAILLTLRGTKKP